MGVPDLVPQIMYGAFFMEHLSKILQIDLAMLWHHNFIAPLIDQVMYHIAGKTKSIPHIIGDIKQIFLHIPQIEIAGIIIHGHRLEQRLHIITGRPQENKQNKT